MFENVKTIFIDLDGTALDIKNDNGYWISSENLKAIEEIKQSGKNIVVSTGRLKNSCYKYIEIIKPKYSVTGNGSIILDENMKVVAQHSIDTSNNSKLVKIISSHNLVIKLEDFKHAYGVTRAFAKKQAKDWGYKPFEDYSFDLEQHYFKFVVWGTDKKDELLSLQKEIESSITNISTSISNGGYTLEITHEKANKGYGNSLVLKLMNLSKEDAIHIGDSMNDAHVIGHVAAFVALENSSDDVKRLTPFRGPSFENGGLAKVLRGNIWKEELK